MSYVRWSSVIGSDVSIDQMIDEMKAGTLKSRDMTKRQLETPESYQSDWYIFWHNMEYVSDEIESKEDQFLAMYLKGEGRSPVLPYEEVKEMYESDDWSALGYSVIPQKDLLRDCVKSWLEDVEEEFSE